MQLTIDIKKIAFKLAVNFTPLISRRTKSLTTWINGFRYRRLAVGDVYVY